MKLSTALQHLQTAPEVPQFGKKAFFARKHTPPQSHGTPIWSLATLPEPGNLSPMDSLHPQFPPSDRPELPNTRFVYYMLGL